LGSNGLGDYIQNKSFGNNYRQQEHAVTALIRLINQKPNVYTLVLLGPMTNLALAVRLDPSIGTKLKSIIFVGGSTNGKANISLTSEQNIQCDAEAAHIVLQSFHVPVYMISWELTLECAISWKWYDDWIKNAKSTTKRNSRYDGESIQDFLYQSTRKHEEMCRKSGTQNFNMCDSVGIVAVLLSPSLVKAHLCMVSVELSGTLSRGSTVVDYRDHHRHNVCVVTSINKEGIQRLWEEIVSFNPDKVVKTPLNESDPLTGEKQSIHSETSPEMDINGKDGEHL